MVRVGGGSRRGRGRQLASYAKLTSSFCSVTAVLEAACGETMAAKEAPVMEKVELSTEVTCVPTASGKVELTLSMVMECSTTDLRSPEISEAPESEVKRFWRKMD